MPRLAVILSILALPAFAQQAPVTDRWQSVAGEAQAMVVWLQNRNAELAAKIADQNAEIAALKASAGKKETQE